MLIFERAKIQLIWNYSAQFLKRGFSGVFATKKPCNSLLKRLTRLKKATKGTLTCAICDDTRVLEEHSIQERHIVRACVHNEDVQVAGTLQAVSQCAPCDGICNGDFCHFPCSYPCYHFGHTVCHFFCFFVHLHLKM